MMCRTSAASAASVAAHMRQRVERIGSKVPQVPHFFEEGHFLRHLRQELSSRLMIFMRKCRNFFYRAALAARGTCGTSSRWEAIPDMPHMVAALARQLKGCRYA